MLLLLAKSRSLGSLELFHVVWQDFSIEFVFSHNEWFTNDILTMTYQVKCEVDEADPWAFEGATIYSCKG